MAGDFDCEIQRHETGTRKWATPATRVVRASGRKPLAPIALGRRCGLTVWEGWADWRWHHVKELQRGSNCECTCRCNAPGASAGRLPHRRPFRPVMGEQEAWRCR